MGHFKQFSVLFTSPNQYPVVSTEGLYPTSTEITKWEFVPLSSLFQLKDYTTIRN